MEQLHFENKPNNPSIRELIKIEPDAIFILAGAIKFNENKKRYESGSFQDKDENSGLVTGGKDRILATVELNHLFPKTNIIPMSRTKSPEKPTYAAIMKSELLLKNIKENIIIEESVSVDTITEFIEAIRIIEKHQWKSPIFISSNFHIPRAQALLNHIENFVSTQEDVAMVNKFVESIRDGKICVQFIGAGDILKAKSPHYKKLFANIEQSTEYKKREALEAKGLTQINSEGNYGNYNLTKKIFDTLSNTAVFKQN